MNPNKALWEKGDFTKVAASMQASGGAVVKSITQNQCTNVRVTVSV